MNWLYTHVRALPDAVETHVVCQWSQNLDQFPITNLVSAERPPKAPSFIRKVRRRLRLWDDESRHLALLDETIRRVQPDVLHSHFGHCGWAASKVAGKYNLRHIVNFYGVDLSYLPQADRRWVDRYREMSRRVDLVLCEGPHMAKCIADVGVDPAKIHLFRLGIDRSRIPFVPRQNRKDRPKRFLIVGSYREKKGIPYALAALGMLARRCPDIEVTVMGDSGGSAREEAEKRKIAATVEEYSLAPRTRFLGYQPNSRVVREFYAHDIFVSPSVTSADGDTEGGAPVTVIEAAASGMPVASTTHCDIPFVLSNENREYLVPERDPAALCEALERLLRRNDWDPITAANRQLVEAEMDLKQQAEKLASIYEGIPPDHLEVTAARAGD
jgi:colanic acid/amylovoran biosynthesis glycosyltransferase